MITNAITVHDHYTNNEAEPTNAEASNANGDKRQDKRGLDHHEDVHVQKTVTIVKNVPVPYKVEKLHPVKIEKIVHVPVEVKIPKPFPVVRNVPYPVSICANIFWMFMNLASVAMAN